AAGGDSNEPVELAARLCRDRGRVIDIGKCRLDLPWNAYYEKELDVRFSRSYGPGRYDPEYELEGRDYPIGYVRWTERRNLACFLDLIARGRIDVEPLISHIAAFDDAVGTYQRLKDGGLKAVAVLFRYPGQAVPAEAPEMALPSVRRRGGAAAAPSRAATSPVRLAFVGAGNYATSMLLPHLARRDGVELAAVVTTTALSGANAQRKFGFAHATTDLDAVLGDKSVDAVFVVTRHSSHAELTRRALLAGKAVFVEKPLALTEDELAGVLAAVEESGNDRLQVGFNRRFAPLLRQARQRFGPRTGPAHLRYLVNAGRLEQGSWYLRQDTEGTRFAGEGGHFIDTASWLLQADPVSVYAVAASSNEDLQVVLRYPDESTATLSYVTTGSPGFPKETLDLVADGKVLRLDDFVRAAVYDGRRKQWVGSRLPKARDKGQNAQLAAFVRAVRTGGPMPVPLESLVATTAATLSVRAALAGGAPVTLTGAR
ncbi:Gfo/Idh/MocA family oxidoreductase, partial [Streptomyces albus]|uniref:Gfo/Idh/MocA family oxidoreductase n=2 Tax=Streptomyces TaxID=1883 RepID=UPI0006E40ACB